MEYKANLQKRRVKLFALMATSFLSVLVMFFIDGYMHLFFTEFTTQAVILTLTGRLLQYFSVLVLIYYFLYWPFRMNYAPRTKFDVSSINASFDNQVAIDNRQNEMQEMELIKKHRKDTHSNSVLFDKGFINCVR